MAACCTANRPSNRPEGRSTTDTRFWGTVDRTGDCWIWTASVTNQGVGQYRVGRRMVRAHRWAWELTHGAAPAGGLCHACGESELRPLIETYIRGLSVAT